MTRNYQFIELLSEGSSISQLQNECNQIIDKYVNNGYILIFMSTNNRKLPVLKCLRCGYIWCPRVLKTPVFCPRCKSFYWNKPAIVWKLDVKETYIIVFSVFDTLTRRRLNHDCGICDHWPSCSNWQNPPKIIHFLCKNTHYGVYVKTPA